MLPQKRKILVFASRFAVVLAILIVPWRWLGEAYSQVFSLASTVSLEMMVDDRAFTVRFEPTDAEAEPWGVRFFAPTCRRA